MNSIKIFSVFQALLILWLVPFSSPKAYAWTDPQLTTSTPIRAKHINELRDVIDKLRQEYLGLPKYKWTENPVKVDKTPIRKKHIEELRIALSEVYNMAGQKPPTFTDVLKTNGTPIRIRHILELRKAIDHFIYKGPVECVESDKGKHFKIKGTTKIISGEKILQKAEDYCTNAWGNYNTSLPWAGEGEYVREYFCCEKITGEDCPELPHIGVSSGSCDSLFGPEVDYKCCDGACVPQSTECLYCGDKTCRTDLGEDCHNCEIDCGACSGLCGNTQCDEGETCDNCAIDCCNTCVDSDSGKNFFEKATCTWLDKKRSPPTNVRVTDNCLSINQIHEYYCDDSICKATSGSCPVEWENPKTKENLLNYYCVDGACLLCGTTDKNGNSAPPCPCGDGVCSASIECTTCAKDCKGKPECL